MGADDRNLVILFDAYKQGVGSTKASNSLPYIIHLQSQKALVMTITVQNKTSRGAIAVYIHLFYTPGPPVVGGADELNMGKHHANTKTRFSQMRISILVTSW